MRKKKSRNATWMYRHLGTILLVSIPLVVFIVIGAVIPLDGVTGKTEFNIPDDAQCVIIGKEIIGDGDISSRQHVMFFESVDGRYGEYDNKPYGTKGHINYKETSYVSESVFQQYEVGDELTGSEVKSVFELSDERAKASEPGDRFLSIFVIGGVIGGMFAALGVMIGTLIDEVRASRRYW